ncbi:MAG: hypothetical protein UX07_C0055G0007, partial [Parcubacteria group bacterium GW2011_GWA2_45_30]
MKKILIYGIGAYAAGMGRTLERNTKNKIIYWVPINTSEDVKLFVELSQNSAEAVQNLPHKISMPSGAEYIADIGTIREADIA